MNEIPIASFVSAMNAAGPEIATKTWAACSSAVRVMSVSGVKRNINEGVDIHGKPLAPLKYPRPNGGDKPLRDKGLLAASISATVTEREITLAANSPGAALQNYGGTVRPKRAKALAIPVSKEAKRVGSPGGGRFPRPLFVLAVGSASGNAVLAENVGGKLVVHYVLAKSVTVPARQFLGWRADTLASIGKLLSEKYAAEVAKVFKGRW